MADTVQELREMLALARTLRRVAQDGGYDEHHDLFLDTAAALEARALTVATSNRHPEARPTPAPVPDTRTHTPVNVLV